MQFLYKLKLIPRLHDKADWTDEDNNIVHEHFKVLQSLLKENKLILAGKTANLDASTFGLVILQVDNEGEAREIMDKDPTVAGGIMTAELYPYSIALYNENFRVGSKSL
jgi:uncharacterized protein